MKIKTPMACWAGLSGAAVLMCVTPGGASAQTRAADLASRCSQVQNLSSGTLEIRSAVVRSAGEAGQEVRFCEVQAWAKPTAGSRIGVVVRMPDAWNGKVVEIGGGGMAGNIVLSVPALPSFGALPRIRAGYATIQNDTGHESPEVWNTEWAKLPDGRPNWDAIEDFAYRAVHEAAVRGKQIVASYYGRPQTRAYFYGCSTGGRQALMEAQRFPDDFDGIVGGAPVYDQRVASTAERDARIVFEAGLTAADAPLINASVLKSCDGLDGLKDGVIANPQACHWDPAQLACHGADVEGSCLSERKIAGLREPYQDSREPSGRIAAFAVPFGSEMISIPKFVSIKGDFGKYVGMTNLRAVQFEDPDYDFSKWDPARDYFQQRTTPYAFMLDAVNPDISPFLRKGGKLIIHHGTYDDAPNWRSTVDYYVTMSRVTGVQLKAQGYGGDVADSARLFLAPGVGHCGGGPGADTFDLLPVLDAWVEGGPAPDRVIARHVPRPSDPPRATDVVEVVDRPLCAFPTLAVYDGHGDTKSASSFACRVMALKTDAR
ncbi:MAG: tannase/feruloyl esterase family alpha/beta hydrolase [Caulobacteraceae bacterium]|nr:tannase/feruloyl esterase family alpha/beta hydrolase [Caulobacteraceae bacterium]